MITASNAFSGVPPLFANLSKILSGDIDCSTQAITSHSTDGSPYRIDPQAVIYPKNTTDIRHAIAFAREYRMPLTVHGGGAACTGGSLGEGVILDMARYFTHTRQINMMEHTITVDAGVTVREVQEKLAVWNLEIPVLRGEYGNATIGGFVATKSATASSFYTGSIREWIEGMTIVVDTGEEHHIKDGVTPSGRLLGIYQSVFPLLSEHEETLRAARREEHDDATGYFLWNTSIGPRQLLDQLVGSEGTLAIITSVTFRVAAMKAHGLTYLLPTELASLDTCIDIARHHKVEAIRLFDSAYRKLCEESHPGTIPPDVSEAPYYLLLTLRDNDEHILGLRASTCLRSLPHGELAHELDEKKVLPLLNHKVKHDMLLAHASEGSVLSTIGEGIIVSRQWYSQCIRDLDHELRKSGVVYVLSGCAGSGHLSVTALFDSHAPSYPESLFHHNDSVCKIVERFKGGISAVGGEGLERSAYLQYVYNDATLKIFSLLKRAWDPLALFNPGKKTGISLEYLRKHLRAIA